MKSPIDWLRHWNLFDDAYSAWDHILCGLGLPAKEIFPRLRPWLEPLEVRLAPSTSPVGTAFLSVTRQSFSGVIGSFTIESGYTSIDYSVTVLWGDGKSSMATVDSYGNVSASHTYNAAGDYAVAFQVKKSNSPAPRPSASASAWSKA